MTKPTILDPEIEAMNVIYNVLANLDQKTSDKVLTYIVSRFAPELLEPKTVSPPLPPMPAANGKDKIGTN